MVRISRVVRFRVTKRRASGTQTRRVWMLRFCQRFVLMLECETFCAFNLRLPVMSLLAMTYARFGTRPSVPARVKAGNLTDRSHLVKPWRRRAGSVAGCRRRLVGSAGGAHDGEPGLGCVDRGEDLEEAESHRHHRS